MYMADDAAVKGVKVRCGNCGAKVRIPADLTKHVRVVRAAIPRSLAVKRKPSLRAWVYKVLKKIAKGGMGVVYEGVTPDGFHEM